MLLAVWAKKSAESVVRSHWKLKLSVGANIEMGIDPWQVTEGKAASGIDNDQKKL